MLSKPSSPATEAITDIMYCSKASAAGNTETTSSVRCSAWSRNGLWEKHFFVSMQNHKDTNPQSFIRYARNSLPIYFHKVYGWGKQK
jgi:hypothetical protein